MTKDRPEVAPTYLTLVCPDDGRAHLAWSHEVLAASVDPVGRLPTAICGRPGCEPYDQRRMTAPLACEPCARLVRQVDGARCIGSPRRNHASTNLLDTALWVIATAARDEAAARHRGAAPSTTARDTGSVLDHCGGSDATG